MTKQALSKRYTVTTAARPFSSEGRGKYKFEVEPDGTIRVYDSVAGHFVLARGLSVRDANRVRDRSGWTSAEREANIRRAYERRHPGWLAGAGEGWQLRPEVRKFRRSTKSGAELDAEIDAALARSEKRTGGR
jgi:hypothetical protein